MPKDASLASDGSCLECCNVSKTAKKRYLNGNASIMLVHKATFNNRLFPEDVHKVKCAENNFKMFFACVI